MQAALFISHSDEKVRPSFEHTGRMTGSQSGKHSHRAIPNLLIAHSSPNMHRTLRQGFTPVNHILFLNHNFQKLYGSN